MTTDRNLFSVTDSRLAARLREYAAALGLAEAEVSSLKLRPVMPGAQYTDPFGHTDANAYLFDSEYRAGQAVCSLGVLDPRLEGRDLHVRHPVPWSREQDDFVQGFNDASPSVWIQHESGLEILFVVAAVATLVTEPFTLFQAYEAIRSRVSANAMEREADRRYCNDVNRIRVEHRQLDRGELSQELVVSLDIHKPLDPHDVATMVATVVDPASDSAGP